MLSELDALRRDARIELVVSVDADEHSVVLDTRVRFLKVRQGEN